MVQEKLDEYMYALIYAPANLFLQRSKLFFQSGKALICCLALLPQLLVLLSQFFNNTILQEMGGLCMWNTHTHMNACTYVRTHTHTHTPQALCAGN